MTGSIPKTAELQLLNKHFLRRILMRQRRI